MSDFDYSLDFPCRPGVACPCRESERAAIVAWLRTGAGRIDRPNRFVLADGIEFRHHLRGDDE